MGQSVYTSLLIKDFKRKAGDIKSLRKDLRDLAKIVIAMEKEQSALLTIIQSRDSEFLPSSVKPNATIPKVLGLPWNRLSILVLEAIKNSETQPVQSRDITNYVIINGLIEIENKRAQLTVHACVRACLKRLKRRGKVINAYDGTIETAGLWRLVTNE